MHLHLSSFRLGPHQRRLLKLLGTGRRTGLVTNAVDLVPARERTAGLDRDIAELSAVGLEVTLLDLRGP